MNSKQVLSTYREEVNKLRWKLNQLEVNSIEQRASDEVRQWRQKFETFSCSEMERILNEMEKRKQSEVSHLINELRTDLEQFKETTISRLAQLDALISRPNIEDNNQLNYIKFELDSIAKKIETLQIDILVQTVDASKRRRSSTAFTRNTLELIKVFEFKTPSTTTTTTTTTTSNFLEPLRKFVRRASIAGASYYNIEQHH